MGIVMGPVLSFRGVDADGYRVGVLVVTEDIAVPSLRFTSSDPGQAGEVEPLALATHRGKARGGSNPRQRQVWRFDLSIKQQADDQSVGYTVAGESWTFVVPAAGHMPRLAFTSCNGFSSLRAMKNVEDKNALWKILAERHQTAPYHLLLMGGDQVYADSMWETLEPLKRWNELPLAAGNRAPFTPALSAQVRDFYFNLYCERWTQAEIRPLLASIPTLMMWDDHDIFDGWGSYPPARHASPVFQGIFASAREHFRLFQRQEGAAEPASVIAPACGFSFGHRVGDLAILGLDLRSERCLDFVLSPAHWNAALRWIDCLSGHNRCRHLLVMSSIPVIHPSFDVVERTLGMMPGSQELEDDLRDHWRSRSHKAERLRLIHRLLAFAEREATRVTIISGDVHLAALGVLQTERQGPRSDSWAVINQLTSSGIVHPPPPAVLLFALEHLFPQKEDVDRGISAEMTKFPGTERRYIGARNWLSLEPDDPLQNPEARLWANWIVEGERVPFTKVIHPAR